MFRPMRRLAQQLETSEAVDVLKKARRGVLSVIGDGGWPYGVYMNHLYSEEDGRIYFHGSKAGHKLDALRADCRAAFTVIDEGRHDVARGPGWALTFRSVVVFGRIEFVDDSATALDACRRLARRFTSDGAYVDDEIRRAAAAVQVFALVPEHITCKRVREA